MLTRSEEEELDGEDAVNFSLRSALQTPSAGGQKAEAPQATLLNYRTTARQITSYC